MSNLNGEGWQNIFNQTFVPKEDEFRYALERVQNGTDEEKAEFVEWFYSGNWVQV